MREKTYRLLVVDDEVTMRRSLADILRLEGYQVVAVPSGEAAIATLKRDKFDLILLDLKMPGVDGLEVLRFVTQATPETQVILLTAHGSLESAIEALRHGARDYLLKPSSPGQILESVARGLSARKELDQKQRLLEQLEISVQQLRGIESPTPSTSETDIHSIGDGIQVDLVRREIYHANIQVNLTLTEGRLMKLFLENRAHLFTHRELVFLLQGYETNEWEAPGILRPIISRLRKKLNRLPGGSDWIVSIRGTGYLFDPGEVNEK